jgi:thiol-disulfide isomerase/thioredoxin
LLVPLAAAAEDRLDISALLAERGTRLLVVEFYATWCAPCMRAMPRWKQLKERYAAQGLRIAVVNTRDPQGATMRCQGLPFSPDASLCDLEGTIEASFGVGGALPAAFLWSWQGNLLVQKGHVDEVEREIERYLRAAPRVVVARGADVPPAVEAAVKHALGRDGKVLVVANEEEQRMLDAVRSQQARSAARYDEQQQCSAGKELPANSVLRIDRVARGKAAYLTLGLKSLESGCLIQGVSADWSASVAAMADEVVAKLLRQLRRDQVQLPGQVVCTTQAPRRPLGPRDQQRRPHR